MSQRSPSATVQGALLILITFAVYAPALFHGFVWDDYPHLLINGLIPKADGLNRIWFHLEFQQYQPLQLTTHWFEYRIWGFNPLGYHAVNIVLHAGVGLLSWRVLLKLEVRAAWLCAAIFLVHPVNAETAAYVTERRNLLSGACFLASLLCWFRFEARGQKRWYAAALAIFFLGLFAKTVICSLPVILLLLRWMRGMPLRIKHVAQVVPFFIVALPLALLTAFMEKYLIGANGYEWAFTFPQRLIICGHALWFYAWKIVWPVNLMFFYPRWNVDAADWTQWLYVAGVAFVGVSLIPITRRFGRRPAAALLYFAITLFPALGFANVYPQRFSFVADHFQYLATIGIIALVVGILHSLYERALAASDNLRSAQRLPLFANAALPLVLSALLLNYLPALNNDDTVYADILSKNNDCWIAHTNVGVQLFNRGDYAASTQHLEEAHRIVPHELEVMKYLGESYEKQGRAADARRIFELGIADSPAAEMIANARDRENFIAGKGFLNVYENHRIDATMDMHLDLARLDHRERQIASAEEHLKAASSLRPLSVKPLLARAEILAGDGRFAEALAECDRAAELKSNSALPLCTKADLFRSLLKRDFSRQQNAEEYLQKAEAAYRAALAREPGHLPSLTGLCEVLLMQKKVDEAETLIQSGLAAGRSTAELQLLYASVLQAKGDLSGAAQAYNRALELEPKNVKALSGFANLCLQSNKFNLAEALFRQVLEIAPNSHGDRENLAIALAQQNQYDEAIKLLQQCLTASYSVALELNLEHLLIKARRYSDAIALIDKRFAEGIPDELLERRFRRDLAWLLATVPDEHARAGLAARCLANSLVSNAKETDAADAMSVLAAAQAETGDYPAAATTSKEAFKKANDANQPALAQEIAERQKLYESGKPYRLP